MKKHTKIKGLLSQLLFAQLWMVLLLGPQMSMAQGNSLVVTGTVSSADDGMPLPGVSIVVKNTTKGVTTDFDGNYRLEVDDANAVLVFSYLGFETYEEAVNGRTRIDVSLNTSTENLDEVVVTALGIKREDKSLGYSVENVAGEELTRVAQENVLNSLSGKVAGVTLNNTGGTGSSVSMVIRGAISLSSDNQPLFVIDGVPVANTLNNIGGFGDRNPVDYGNAISDLDPNSIEDVTILKGPSAAALYGSRAGNGVVLITTKKAEKGQRMKVNFTSNTVFDIPYRYIDTQSRFGSGYFSYSPASEGGSMIMPDVLNTGGNGGPELDKGYFAVQWNSPLDANGNPIPIELKSYPNNIKEFVRNGITTTNSMTVSSSNEIVNYRLGVTAMDNSGVIPNSDLQRNSFSLSASSNMSDKLTVSTNINVVHSYADNRPASNRGTNPLQAAYSIPANVNILDIKDYKLPGTDIYNFSSDYENPWFLANEVNNSFSRFRVYGNLALDWNAFPGFNLRTSYNLNSYSQTQETKMAPGYTRESNNGTYGIAETDGLETNVDLLASYNKAWGKFDMTVSAGGNLMYQRDNGLINSAATGAGLIVPNLFTVDNIAPAVLQYSSYTTERAINSVYAMANFGMWDMLYLDLTARNDWSSTLPVDNRSYFYPSASLSFLLSELVNIPKVDLLKFRGGWAQVGNDTDPYQLGAYYNNAGQWDNAVLYTAQSGLNTPGLEPEKATSHEFGVDLTMFGNRLRFEGTYYTVENKNQIVPNIPIPGSSGYNSVSINAGVLESKGYELSLGLTPISSENWNWDLNLNFTTNESKILALADGVDYIEFWSDNKSVSRGYVANPATGEDGLVGNIYSPQIKRVTDVNSPYYNYPLLGQGEDAEWLPTEERVKVGNYNPDFIMGLQSSLSYKNFTLNLTFDWRSGGQYMSQTSRYLVEDGYGQQILDNLVNPGISEPGPELKQWVLDNADRLIYGENFLSIGGPPGDGGFAESLGGRTVYDGIFNAGVVGTHDEDGNFILDYENLGEVGTNFIPFSVANPWEFGTPHMFDADFIKLREVSIGYDLPAKSLERIGIQGLNFSIYSRNIMLWTKDSQFGVDPERAFQAETSSGNRGTQFKQGIERYNVEPWLVPIGIKIGVTF
ncbi:SusC/RagA family TonB-linked outer membrane protein [Pseudozobellia thermophila]|uniref:TonB-linked outer membrane protein, SusC/RagA family n=1 Tax=Pseudozobellia thermophila TaxID=192903 RepID=A0A1M6I5R0_9FLAO|nr:SusC/RagA family TonB-linked outer membrane protein [Pseudozobellia thermophila]SHJ29714.1 TonB-linked outer membrane protein, SusC/RagA family [Pseudozobellia thermophila]